MQPLTGATRLAFLGFFASHIPITMIVDSQALFGRFYPSVLQDLLAWYAETTKDPLMGGNPFELWFKSFVVCELAFQIPYFFSACYYLLSYTNRPYPDGFRMASVAYGAHTATTLVPILATLATASGLSVSERLVLVSFYLPYLFFPVGILLLAAFDPRRSPPNKAKVF